MNVLDVEVVLNRLLKWLAVAIGIFLLALILLKIIGPAVKGTPPDQAILDVDGLMDAASFSDRRITTVDFVDRPLFRPDRRPPPEVVPAANNPNDDLVPVDNQLAESFRGVIATGVFASGGSSGVFLTADSGERSRVQVGDGYEGWVLASVDETGANFVAGARRARVDLRLNFNPVLLAEPVSPVAEVESSGALISDRETGESSADSRSESAEKGEDNAVAPRQRLTFDSIMRDRVRAQETQEQQSSE